MRGRAARGSGSRSRGRIDGATLAAFALPLVIYVATLAPTVYNLDSAELSTAAFTGGLVRATGYPTYLVIGRAWSRLPVGDVGWRMNLLSAVCGALTLALVTRILRRLGVGPLASLSAVGLLAFSRYFWAMSLIAEVYTLHTTFVAVIVLLMIEWRDRPTAGRLAVAALLVGLSFGNHVATVLLVPGITWMVLRTTSLRLPDWRSSMAAAGGLLAGLGIYLYLPMLYLATPEFNYAGQYDATGTFLAVDLTTPAGLWWLVSGRVFAGHMLAYTPSELVGEIGHFLAELWRAFMGIGIGPGLLGAVVAWRHDRRLGPALVLMFAVTAGFYIDYRVVDKDTMFLPAYVVWTLWLGVGYQWLLDWLRDPEVDRRRRTTSQARHLVSLAIAGAVVFAIAWNGPRIDLSDDWSARRRGEDVLAAMEPGALLLGWWATVPLVEYLQLVEGHRPDVKAVNRFLISTDDFEALVRRQIGTRPVYVDEPPQRSLSGVEMVPVGPLLRLESTSQDSAESGATGYRRRESFLVD